MEVKDITEEICNSKHQEGIAVGGSRNKAFAGKVVKAVLGEDEFALSDKGLYHVVVDQDRIDPLMLISAPLKIVADTRDTNGDNWGRILEFKDKDGNVQQYVMKMQDLKRDGEEIVEALLARGLSIAPGKKARLRLVEYVQNCQPENNARARSTDMTGWHGRRFVLSNGVIGDGDERIIYHGRQPEAKTYCQKGTAQEWKNMVAGLCVGNSRLALAVATAFAAPILRIIGMEGGGVHFVGNSSTGKSTALYVAASVMGNPEHYIQSWRATGNGLEGIAKFHNDTCLIIDEMGQVQAKEAGEISYMLANGSGKLRANIKGDARQKATWRLLFLSSGEVTLAEHMNEGGKTARAGMEIRLVDIQADAGKDLGIFEDLRDHRDGATFSDILKENTVSYHGVAFREFLKRVIADGDLVRPRITELQDEFFEEHVPATASGQVRRVATRFAIIAAAGELATDYGITGWPQGEAIRAAATCFGSWLELRGGTGQQEAKTLLDQIRGFFEKYGDSRFVHIALAESAGYRVFGPNRVTDRAGFKYSNLEGKLQFYVLPEGFKEMCKGYNVKAAAKILLSNGVISPGKNGKSQKSVRLPDMGVRKVYHFNTNIWQDSVVTKTASSDGEQGEQG